MTDRGVIEAMLLGWIDNQTGRKVTFLLPDDEGDHPFKGLKCGPAHGQRVALSFALIADDESQTEPADTGGAAECGRDDAVHDARTARQSGDGDAPEPHESEPDVFPGPFDGMQPDPAAEATAAQPEADAIAEEARDGADPYHYQRQAGMRCKDDSPNGFHEFIRQRHAETAKRLNQFRDVPYSDTDEQVTDTVREICRVQSRKEFDTDPDAAKRWRGLMAEFDKWRGLV